MTPADRISSLLAHARRLTALRNEAAARADWRATPVYCGITGGRAASMSDPRLAHSNWLHVSFFNGDPSAGVPPVTFPNGMPAGLESPYDIPLENAAWIGRLCRDGGVARNREGEPVPFVAGAPIVVDFEGSYHDPKTNGPLPAEKYAKLGRLVRTIRESAAPGQVIAINAATSFGNPPTWQQLANLTPQDKAKLIEGFKPYKPLFDQVDVLIGDFCVLGPEEAAGHMLAATNGARATKEATGKPFWGLLDSHYRNAAPLLSAQDARLNMETALRECDGVWVWSGYADWVKTYGAN